MNLRTFCTNPFQVSELGLGLSQLSQTKNTKHYGYKSEKEVFSIIEHAIKKKINFFDTSDGYGDTEKILGRLKKKQKEKIIISTKAGRKTDGSRCFDKKYLETQLDKSLKNLKMKRIDVFMLNKPSYEIIVKEDLLSFLQELKQKGKIRYSGIVIGNKKNFHKIIKNKKIDCFSVLFNILNTDDIDLLKLIAKHDKGLIVRSPLNSGILAGNINSKTKFNSFDERSRYFFGKNFEKKILKTEYLKKELRIKEKNLLKFSLDFILYYKFISTVLVGCSSMKQLKNIVAYQSKTKYLNKKKHLKTLKFSYYLSKKYKTNNQSI